MLEKKEKKDEKYKFDYKEQINYLYILYMHALTLGFLDGKNIILASKVLHNLKTVIFE